MISRFYVIGFIAVLLSGIFVLNYWVLESISYEKIDDKIKKEVMDNRTFFLSSIERNTTITHNLVFVAKENKVEILEGKETLLWNYNGMFPGPIIKVKKGDRINVTIINELDVPTTIHWHGMRVPNQMDGVPDITQKPVAPGERFQYNFTVLDEGIYIYHPHYNTPEQIEMGLYGGIVVYDDNDPYYYDKDLLLILDDILLDSNAQVFPEYETMHQRMMGRFGNVLLVNGKIKPTYYVNAGDIVRLRFINIANARTFYVALEKDNKMIPLLVVGEDIGFANMPIYKEGLVIASGQRYDVIALIEEPGEYYLTYYAPDGKYVLATLITNESNTNMEEKRSLMKENERVRIYKEDYVDLVENVNNTTIINIDLYAENEGMGMMNMRWTINGKAYPDETLYIPVNEGEYYILEFRNLNRIPHPMHLHGQRMLILDGNERYEFKDTVLVEPLSSLRVIFKAEGKGLWLFHCHILEHAEAGMTSVVEVR